MNTDMITEPWKHFASLCYTVLTTAREITSCSNLNFHLSHPYLQPPLYTKVENELIEVK